MTTAIFVGLAGVIVTLLGTLLLDRRERREHAVAEHREDRESDDSVTGRLIRALEAQDRRIQRANEELDRAIAARNEARAEVDVVRQECAEKIRELEDRAARAETRVFLLERERSELVESQEALRRQLREQIPRGGTDAPA